MDPSLISAIIGAGAGGAQLAAGATSNRKNRAFSDQMATRNHAFAREMYDKQRQDAQYDWAQQNAYNSPEQVMARLKAAGLNPNLVYGSGASFATATPVRSSSQGTGSNPPAHNDPSAIVGGLGTLGNILSEFLNLQKTQAQTDNLRIQKELLDRDIAYREAGTRSLDQGTATSAYDLKYKEHMQATRETQEKATLTKTIADTQFTIDQNERNELKNSSDIAKTAQDILNQKTERLLKLMEIQTIPLQREKIQQEINQIRENTQKLSDERVVSRLNAELAQKGVRPSDHNYWRIFIELLNELK